MATTPLQGARDSLGYLFVGLDWGDAGSRRSGRVTAIAAMDASQGPLPPRRSTHLRAYSLHPRVVGEILLPAGMVVCSRAPCIAANPAAERAHHRASRSGRQQRLQ